AWRQAEPRRAGQAGPRGTTGHRIGPAGLTRQLPRRCSTSGMSSPAPVFSAPAALESRARARLHGPPLPLPGCGSTLGRWRALAAIGAEDLALAKVLEAHHDARAILAELGAPPPVRGVLLAVWAAEGP